MAEKLKWMVTPWNITPKGKWDGEPPWIVVEGRIPFKASHPRDYIAELERLHQDRELVPGPFHTLIGQFKDAIEMSWKDQGESQ
jgi:hypothetical protein